MGRLFFFMLLCELGELLVFFGCFFSGLRMGLDLDGFCFSWVFLKVFEVRFRVVGG